MPRDANINGRRVLDKLKYSGMIEYYRKLFGAEKVHVVFFETLVRERHPLQQLLEELGVKEGFPKSPPEKENRGQITRGKRNHAPVKSPGRQQTIWPAFRAAFSCDRREADRQQARKLFPGMVEEWREDNRRLADILQHKSSPAYAL